MLGDSASPALHEGEVPMPPPSLTGLVAVPVSVHHLITTQPVECSCLIDVLQSCPKILPIPAVDEAAYVCLLEPGRTATVSDTASRDTELPMMLQPSSPHLAGLFSGQTHHHWHGSDLLVMVTSVEL